MDGGGTDDGSRCENASLGRRDGIQRALRKTPWKQYRARSLGRIGERRAEEAFEDTIPAEEAPFSEKDECVPRYRPVGLFGIRRSTLVLAGMFCIIAAVCVMALFRVDPFTATGLAVGSQMVTLFVIYQLICHSREYRRGPDE